MLNTILNPTPQTYVDRPLPFLNLNSLLNMSTNSLQNHLNAHHVERTKIELRESSASVEFTETKLLASDLRANLMMLMSSEGDSDERFEIARLHSQRDSIGTVFERHLRFPYPSIPSSP